MVRRIEGVVHVGAPITVGQGSGYFLKPAVPFATGIPFWLELDLNSFQSLTICRSLGAGSEGIKWPITPNLSSHSRVAMTAQHRKMPVNWICGTSYTEPVA